MCARSSLSDCRADCILLMSSIIWFTVYGLQFTVILSYHISLLMPLYYLYIT